MVSQRVSIRNLAGLVAGEDIESLMNTLNGNIMSEKDRRTWHDMFVTWLIEDQFPVLQEIRDRGLQPGSEELAEWVRNKTCENPSQYLWDVTPIDWSKHKTAVAAPAEDTRILIDPATSSPHPPYSANG